MLRGVFTSVAALLFVVGFSDAQSAFMYAGSEASDVNALAYAAGSVITAQNDTIKMHGSDPMNQTLIWSRGVGVSVTSFVVAGDDLIYVAWYQQSIGLLKAATGDSVWKLPPVAVDVAMLKSRPILSPLVTPSTQYVYFPRSNGSIYRIDRAAGSYVDVLPASVPVGYIAAQPVLTEDSNDLLFTLRHSAGGTNTVGLLGSENIVVCTTNKSDGTWDSLWLHPVYFMGRAFFGGGSSTGQSMAVNVVNLSTCDYESWKMPSNIHSVPVAMFVRNETLIVAVSSFVYEMSLKDGTVTELFGYSSELVAAALDADGHYLYLLDRRAQVTKFNPDTFDFAWASIQLPWDVYASSLPQGDATAGSLRLIGDDLFVLVKIDTERYSYAEVCGLRGKLTRLFSGIRCNSSEGTLLTTWGSTSFNGSLIVSGERLGYLVRSQASEAFEPFQRSPTFPGLFTETAIYQLNSNGHFFEAHDRDNGSIIWSQRIVPENTNGTTPSPCSVVALASSSNVIVSHSLDASTSDAIVVLNALTGQQLLGFNLSDFPCAGSSSLHVGNDSIVFDGPDVAFLVPLQGTVGQWTGSNCLVRIDVSGSSGNTSGVSSFHNAKRFVHAPALSLTAVYLKDTEGYVHGFLKSDLASQILREVVHPRTTYGTKNPLKCYDGGLYEISDDGTTLVLIGNEKDEFLTSWEFQVDAHTSCEGVWSFYWFVFVGTDQGRVISLLPGWLQQPEGGHYKLEFNQPLNITANVTAPAISPDGMMFFATQGGVAAMTFTGTLIWVDTSVSDCRLPAIWQGVAYALCGHTLKLYDLYAGRPWLETDATISKFGYRIFESDAIHYISSADIVYEISLEDLQLYDPSELPLPLPPHGPAPTKPPAGTDKWVVLVVVMFIVLVLAACMLKMVFCRKTVASHTEVILQELQSPLKTDA